MTARHSRHLPFTRLGAVLLAAGLLAGCASGDDGAPAPSASDVPTASPLAPYMSLLALEPAAQLRLTLEGERLIASCLKEQGFDYDQPYVADDVVVDDLTDPAEWAATYGYGVTTLSDRSPLVDAEPRSGAEQAAYDLALFGTGTDPESEVAYDWEQEGCLGSAYHEATGGMDDVMRDERFAAFFTAYEAVQDEVAASETASMLAQEWADCMADAGHPEIMTPLDAPLTIERALTTATFTLQDPDALTREIAVLRSTEIDLATTDLGCQDAVDYSARYDQVLWSAQAALLEDFRSELEALALETQG